MWGHIEFNTHDSSHLVATVYADDKQQQKCKKIDVCFAFKHLTFSLHKS